MSDFLGVAVNLALLMLALGLIMLVNSRRLASALKRYAWVPQVVDSIGIPRHFRVKDVSGSGPAVLALRVRPWRRARFETARSVWIAAPAGGAGVLAVDGGRDLVWCRRLRQKTDHSQFATDTQHLATGRPKSRRASLATRRATPSRLRTAPRPPSGTVQASGSGIVRDAAGGTPTAVAPTETLSWPHVMRAFVFGVAVAVPIATAIAAVVASTGSVAAVVSLLLGGCVGYAVAVGGGALPVAVKRLIAVLATALGVTVWVYIGSRQDLEMTRAPLLLPGRTLAAAVAEDVRDDGWIVLFWLLPFLAAARTAAADPPSPQSANGAEPESATRGARLRAWCVGPGRWLIAATSLLIGLAACFVLARAQVESGTRDPMAGLVAGECFNDSQFAVVPCQQPHEDEAYYRYMLPRGPFPGDNRLQDAATNTCDDHLDAYVGSQYADTFYGWPDTPDQFQWAAGDRITICALSPMDNGKITGSARHAH